MKNAIHILHLEDDPLDAELVQARLAAADLACRITWAQTRSEFEDALQHGAPDIILADYRLPGYDGMSALRLVRERWPEIPFVFVSGTMGEEAAIAALTQGATDYVLKHNLSRLAPAVRRALQEAQILRENKQNEDALRENEERFRTLVEQAAEGFFLHDAGKILDVNQAACDMLGYSREELLRLTIWDVDARIEQDQDREKIWERLAPGETVTIERELRCKDGTLFPAEIRLGQVDFRGRRLMLGLARDITARKQVEYERLANLAFFESMDKVNRVLQGAHDLEKMMMDLLDVVISIFDCDRAYLLYPCDPESPTWTVPMERNKPGCPGLKNLKIAMPMDPQVAETFRILLAVDGPVAFGPKTPHALPVDVAEQFGIKSFLSMVIYPKTGSPWQFGMHQCADVRVWTAEETRMFEAIGRRLADGLSSLLTHRDLRQNEEFLDEVVEHIPNMIFVKDAPTLSFVRFNKAGEKLLGYPREALLGKSDYDFFPKHEADYFTKKDRQVLDTKELVDIPEETIRTSDNEERILHTKKIPILDETGKPQYLLGISEDITEQKKLEAHMRQVQKMEAIGQLAGGIAHDFNNILSAITGYTELSISMLEPESQLNNYLDQVLSASGRAKELINQILMFSRETDQELKPIQIAFPVREALKLIKASVPAPIEIRAKILSKASALADPTQIHQIVMNLCTNAAHAMREKGGLLDVRLTDIAIDHEGHRRDYPDAKPGDYIRLTVSDQGHGIDAHYIHRIFDPFFTTKKIGEGTGMGLSVVHGIVKSYGGFIYAHSRLDEGSRFEILIPAQKGVEPPEAVCDISIPTGSESILFVDDEIMIVDIVRHMLQSLGYHVTARTSPIEAWEAFKNNPNGFDLVVTDMAMPKLSGMDLAEKIQRIRPGLPMVLCTGFNLDMDEAKLAARGFKDMIRKPILRRDVAMVVRKTLDRHPQTRGDDKTQ